MSVAQAKVVILVFAMPGCPACHEYLPRLYEHIDMAQQAGNPIVLYQDGMDVGRDVIPVVVLNSTSQDAQLQALCDQHKISALPTTMVLPRWGMAVRYEGALPDADIRDMFANSFSLAR